MTNIIFQIFTLLGGLAFFLYGMKIACNTVEKRTGGRLKTVLSSPKKGAVTGFTRGLATTAVIQSSTATTVMLVGLVNAGLMSLSDTVGIIMGANVGAAITNFFFITVGIDAESSVILKFLSPIALAVIISFMGIVFYMFAKRAKTKDIGIILLSVSAVMFGLHTMWQILNELSCYGSVKNFFSLFSNPLIGILFGFILTVLVQSSASSIGIIQVMSASLPLSYSTVFPIIMGQNIGTCLSAVFASSGTKKEAKRVAFVHLFYNLFASMILVTVFWIIDANSSLFSVGSSPLGIAISNVIFKLLALVVMIPFSKPLEKFSGVFLKNTNTDEGAVASLDSILLATPSVAIAHSKMVATDMAELSISSLKKSMALLKKFDQKEVDEVNEAESTVDQYEDKLGAYLVRLSAQNMTEHDSREVSELLRIIGDFERISDHSVNIVRTAKEIDDKKLSFSDEALKEITVICTALNEILDITLKAFNDNDVETAKRVEPLEQTIDFLKDKLKRRHIKRLQAGKCTIEMGFVFSDLLTNLERISDHCSNIASCIIEISNKSFEMHEYLNSVKNEDDEDFLKIYDEYLKKYSLS